MARKAMFDEVNTMVVAERKFQDWRHGSIDDEPHDVGTWLLLIESELNEAKLAAVKGGTGRDSWRNELVQVAALCYATLEQHGTESMVDGREV